MKLIKAILFMMLAVRKLMLESSMFNIVEIHKMDEAINYTNELVQRMDDINEKA